MPPPTPINDTSRLNNGTAEAAQQPSAFRSQTNSTTTNGTAAPDSTTVKKTTTSMSHSDPQSSFAVKAGLAQMLKGGVIMDVVDAEQARIAEEAGACAVMALERVPADIRAQGGVARMSDPSMIQDIMRAVTIPV
ncbi:Pyridoxal 5'-phosphate synthase subunit, partial [Hortaea werneckii]